MGIAIALLRPMTLRPAIFLVSSLTLIMSASTAWSADNIWTAIITRGFPHDVFTWHLKADGSYGEDGRDATGASIQPTLTGHWTVSGHRMVLRQDGIAYVFDGEIAGTDYRGTLYFNGVPVARFCALKGDKPPPDCDVSA
jgi:hypothetical protein